MMLQSIYLKTFILESHGFQNREMWLVYPTARKSWIPFWENRAAMPNRVKAGSNRYRVVDRGDSPLSTFSSQVRKRQTSIRTTGCSRSLLIRRFCWAVFWPALRAWYSTDAFPRIAEYNNGRKGGSQHEQRRNGSHRNHQLVCRISDPGGLIYGSRHRALRFSRVASFDRLAVHIQDHPRSHNRSEEIAGE